MMSMQPMTDELAPVRADLEADDLAEIDTFDPSVSFRDAKRHAIERWERWYVARLLQHTHGNLSKAARVVDSDRSYLRKLIKKHLGIGAG
mgnify:FL=1